MEAELANQIAQYVQECEITIRNLENKITNLKEQIAQHAVKEQLARVEQRKVKRNDTYTRQTVCEALGCSDFDESSALFHAALGFMKGSQLKNHGMRRIAENRAEQEDEPVQDKRCMKKGRKILLALMVKHMYDGEIARDIELAILKTKRFCTVTLARVSDMQSTFNASAVGAIGMCEGGKVKGQMGLLCSESTLRRIFDLVHDQAVHLGFSIMPAEGKGKVWCWGERDTCLLETAVNMYVKTVYCDACCDNITPENAWIVPITGDLARTSQRGAVVTVMGPKQCDQRLVSQQRTGKSMCQSSALYTPAIAGYGTESELMPYFRQLVEEFRKIERQGFCRVNGYEWKVHIKVVAIADLGFMQKYVQRGGGSHCATNSCMLCSVFRNFRHEGYCGGCRKCRAGQCVHGPDGLQICLHYEACTPEFLEWQTKRYAELCALVPGIPLTALPVWTTVEGLRQECIERCVGEHAGELDAISKSSGKGSYSGQDLTNWILQYCRGGCTLSNDLETGVMHCDIEIVKKCLSERRIGIDNLDAMTLRLQMQEILQLEEEYSKMTLCMKDDRFSPGHPSASALPLDRLIICVLHCPMRTHEKVLTLLLHEACQNKLPQKSKPILDEIAVIVRRLGKLPSSWSYQMDDNNKSTVQKIKMHWDQSKQIFQMANLEELSSIIRLAIPRGNRSNWIKFMSQYVKCIALMTVSRDYTAADLVCLEMYCTETFRLLVKHCGGQDAVTNYFHYLGSHYVWMCSIYGNIWRFRNEGVEAFNKTLSKRYNMFNSAGNKGRVEKTEGGLQVLPFEVLGKWMARYVMWQLGYANNLFIGKQEVLGPTEIVWDVTTSSFVLDTDSVTHDDDDEDDYCYDSEASDSDSDCDSPLTPDENSMCVELTNEESRYTFRKRGRF